MKKIILFIVSIVFFILVVWGSVQKDDAHEVVDKSNKLVYSVSNIPTNLQTITNLTNREQDIICAISRGLVSKNSEGNIVPELAETYEVKDDGIEYDFKIRDDAYWSDGTKITAKDISDFLKELIKVEDPHNISALYDVYGVSNFKKGSISFEEGVAITDVDDTLKIRLNTKNSKFIDELTKPQYRVRKSLPLWNELDKYYNTISYSGDYKINKMTNDEMELKSVKDNSDINITIDTNVETAMVGFKLGNRDIVVNPPNNQLSELSKQNKLLTFPSSEGIYIVINEEKPDFTNNIRMSIYKNLCKAVESFEQQNDQLIDCAEGSYIRDESKDLGKLQARKVDINSAEDIFTIKKLRICALQSNINKDLCDYLISWLKENKNIDATYSLLSDQDFETEKISKDYDLMLLNIDSKNDLNELFNKLQYFFNENQNNLFNEIKADSNDYSSFENELFNQYTILPLVFLNQNICISNNKIGISFDYNGNLCFMANNKVEKATVAQR